MQYHHDRQTHFFPHCVFGGFTWFHSSPLWNQSILITILFFSTAFFLLVSRKQGRKLKTKLLKYFAGLPQSQPKCTRLRCLLFVAQPQHRVPKALFQSIHSCLPNMQHRAPWCLFRRYWPMASTPRRLTEDTLILTKTISAHV